MVYYKLRDGRLVDENDLQSAFYISTGNHAYERPGAYIRWLNNRFGNPIVNYTVAPTLADFVLGNRKIDAIRELREQRHIGLRDAKDAIEHYEKHLRKGMKHNAISI